MIGYKEIDDGVIIMKILVDKMPTYRVECPYIDTKIVDGITVYECSLSKAECPTTNMCPFFIENKKEENENRQKDLTEFTCYNSCKYKEQRPGFGGTENLIRKSKIADILYNRNYTNSECIKRICELIGLRYPWIKRKDSDKKARNDIIDEVSKAIEDKFMSVAPDELYYTYEPYQIVRDVKEITDKLKDK